MELPKKRDSKSLNSKQFQQGKKLNIAKAMIHLYKIVEQITIKKVQFQIVLILTKKTTIRIADIYIRSLQLH